MNKKRLFSLSLFLLFLLGLLTSFSSNLILSSYAELSSSCLLHSYDKYSYYSVIDIKAYNGITCCNNIAIISDNNTIGYLNDLGKDCDDVANDGHYCGAILAKNVKSSIIVSYSKIAQERLNISIIKDNFSNFVIKCKPFDSNNHSNFADNLTSDSYNYDSNHDNLNYEVKCDIYSSDLFYSVSDLDKFENISKSYSENHSITPVSYFIGRQGSTKVYHLYQINNHCGRKQRNLVITFPDYAPPSSPIIHCQTKSNNVLELNWNKSKDNVGVKNYEIYRCIHQKNMNLNDKFKINQQNVLNQSFKCNFVPIENISNTEFTDYCNNCEIYYYIKALDYYNNSARSNICKVYSDSTKPNVHFYLLYPNILLIEGNVSKIKFGSSNVSNFVKITDLTNNVMSHNYDPYAHQTIIVYDKFGNSKKYTPYFKIYYPNLIYFNGRSNLPVFYSNFSYSNQIFHLGHSEQQVNDSYENNNGLLNSKYIFYKNNSVIYRFINHLADKINYTHSFLFLPNPHIEKNNSDMNITISGQYHQFYLPNNTSVVIFKVINLTRIIDNVTYINTLKSDDDLFYLINDLSMDHIKSLDTLINLINQNIALNYYLDNLTLKRKGIFPNLSVFSSKLRTSLTGWFSKKNVRNLLYASSSLAVFLLILLIIIIYLISKFIALKNSNSNNDNFFNNKSYFEISDQKNNLKKSRRYHNAGLSEETLKKIEEKMNNKKSIKREKSKQLSNLIKRAIRDEKDIKIKELSKIKNQENDEKMMNNNE